MKKNKLFKNIIGIASILVMSFVLYVGAFSATYNTPIFTTSTQTGAIGQVLSNVTNQPALAAGVADQYKTGGMTLSELATYNGRNGQPAYVAFKGVVYDVSALSNWRSGSHHGIKAGTDITDVFGKSPHAKSIFKLAVVIGDLN